MDNSEILALVGRVYEAPGRPDAWEPLVLDIARSLDSLHGHMLFFANGKGVIHGFTDPGCEIGHVEYAHDYAPLDVRVHRVLSGPEGRAFATSDLMSGDEIRKCPVHQEFLPKWDLKHLLAVKSTFDRDVTFFSSVLRDDRRGTYEPEAYRILELLHCHLERALRLDFELADARSRASTLEAGLDEIRQGLVLIDAGGEVLFANRPARRILDGHDGLMIAHGRIVALQATDHGRLDRMIASALGQNGAVPIGGSVQIGRPEGRPLVVRALPVSREFSLLSPRAAALLMIADPDQPVGLEPEMLRAFGLTCAEARLAGALAEGCTIDTFAEHACLSEQTVRWTLKQILGKTDTHRQTDLVALLHKMARP